MRKSYIMTVMASNRIGILAAFATGLDELGGNFREISLSLVDDFFTMIMSADFPHEREISLISEHLRAVCAPFDAEITIRDPHAYEASDVVISDRATERYVMVMDGGDRPGILRRVARRLAQAGIDLIDLDGSRSADGARFQARLLLSAPVGSDCLKLQQDLMHDEAGGDFHVTIRHAGLVAAADHLIAP